MIIKSDFESKEDFEWVREEAENAKLYLNEMPWVQSIDGECVEDAIPGIFVLCKFFVTPTRDDIDKELWVVAGDLPAAYFVTDRAGDANSALVVYCDLMDEWCYAALTGNIEDTFPIDIEPTADNVDMLKKRVNFLREKIIS